MTFPGAVAMFSPTRKAFISVIVIESRPLPRSRSTRRFSKPRSRFCPPDARVALAQPGSKRSLDRLGICRCELVFDLQGPVRPNGESLWINELLELSDQLVSQVCGRIRRQARWLGSFGACSPVGRLRRPPGFLLDCSLV